VVGGLTASVSRTSAPPVQFIYDGSFHAYWAYSTIPQANDFIVDATSAPSVNCIQLGTIVNGSCAPLTHLSQPSTGTSRFSSQSPTGVNYSIRDATTIVLAIGTGSGRLANALSTYGCVSTDICWFGPQYGTYPGGTTPVYSFSQFSSGIRQYVIFNAGANLPPSALYSSGTCALMAGSTSMTYSTSGAKPLVGQFLSITGTYNRSGIIITAISGTASPYTITLSLNISTSAGSAVSWYVNENSGPTTGFQMMPAASMISASIYPASYVSAYTPISIYTDTPTTFTAVRPQILRFYAPSTYTTYNPIQYSFYNSNTTLTLYNYDSFSMPVPNNGTTSDTLVSNTNVATLSNKTFLNTIGSITTAAFTLSPPFSCIYNVISTAGMAITFPTPSAGIKGLLLIFRRQSNNANAVNWAIGTGYSFVPYTTTSGASTSGILLTTTQYSTSVFCDGSNWIQLVTQ
jgi:hypothetical protein